MSTSLLRRAARISSKLLFSLAIYNLLRDSFVIGPSERSSVVLDVIYGDAFERSTLERHKATNFSFEDGKAGATNGLPGFVRFWNWFRRADGQKNTELIASDFLKLVNSKH